MQSQIIIKLYINIHSPHPSQPNEWAIQNLYKNFDSIKPDEIYSTGLHPWFLVETNWQNLMDDLKQVSIQSNVVAIGECGLDKVCSTDMALQQAAFIAQIKWANEINKPLIIHCVRSYEEILLLLKQLENKVPVIFHGFNKNITLAEKIIEQGCYLSFGKALFQQRIKEVFAAIPLESLFTETHDPDITIDSIYLEAATAKNISVEALSLQIEKNAIAVFKRL